MLKSDFQCTTLQNIGEHHDQFSFNAQLITTDTVAIVI